MTEKEMKEKTKNIAIAVAHLVEKLPASRINNTYAGQIFRCSASVGANYRAACRGKSTNDFVYKLQVVEEEADETLFFLELLAEFNPHQKTEMRTIYIETETVLKIIVASIKTSIQKDDYRSAFRQSNPDSYRDKNQKSKTDV